MKIENVRQGLKGEPYGQPCLYFNIDGRSASCFWEQKKGIVDRGYLSIDFEDNKPSHLSDVIIRDASDPSIILVSSNELIYSPWLNQKMTEMCDQEVVVDGFLIGDAPEEKP